MIFTWLGSISSGFMYDEIGICWREKPWSVCVCVRLNLENNNTLIKRDRNEEMQLPVTC